MRWWFAAAIDVVALVPIALVSDNAVLYLSLFLVVAVIAWWTSFAAAALSVLWLLGWVAYRLPPVGTFAIPSPAQAEGLAVLAIGSLVGAGLAARLRGEQQKARGRAEQAERLLVELTAVQRREHLILDTLASGVVVRDPAGVITFANAAVLEMYRMTSEEVIGQHVMPTLKTAEQQGRELGVDDLPAMRAAATGQPVRQQVIHVTRRDGGSLWVQVDAMPILGPDGHTTEVVSSWIDVSARKEAEAQLDARLRQQVIVAALGRYALSLSDLDVVLMRASEAMRDGLGADYASVVELLPDQSTCVLRAGVGWTDEPVGTLIPSGPSASLAGHVLHTAAPLIAADLTNETRFVVSDRLRRQKVVSALAVPVATPSLASFAGTLQAYFRDRRSFPEHDIAFMTSVANVLAEAVARRHVEDSLQHMALHDQLTGLPNRILLRDRLEQSLLHRSRKDHKVALLFADLDGFKQVNDSFGHEAGDTLLRDLGQRWTGALRASDTAARLGGDEFAILLPEIADLTDVAVIVDKLQAALAVPFRVAGHDAFVRASIGVVLAPDHGTDADSLTRRADMAMYAAKRTSSGHAVYRVEHEADYEPARITLDVDLRHAIEHEELSFAYQPIIGLRNGASFGFEALVRWDHPTRGELVPEDFLPVGERGGLLQAITRAALQQALATLRDLGPLAARHFMSVNVTDRDLRDPRFVGTVRDALAAAGIAPARLLLEVSERAVMSDLDDLLPVARELRALGLGLVVDDYGTGYSSLDRLRRLPLSGLKLDSSFVAAMLDDAQADAIVQSTIRLARDVRMTVVAEGVERDAIGDRLREVGCRAGQGYALARPMRSAQLREWLTVRADEVRPKSTEGGRVRP